MRNVAGMWKAEWGNANLALEDFGACGVLCIQFCWSRHDEQACEFCLGSLAILDAYNNNEFGAEG